MSIDRIVIAFAGSVVLLSLLLSQLHSPAWLWLTAFVGANLLQSAFTGFCPLAKKMEGSRPADRRGLSLKEETPPRSGRSRQASRRWTSAKMQKERIVSIGAVVLAFLASQHHTSAHAGIGLRHGRGIDELDDDGPASSPGDADHVAGHGRGHGLSDVAWQARQISARRQCRLDRRDPRPGGLVREAIRPVREPSWTSRSAKT